MHRRLITAFVVLLVAAACSSSTTEDPSASYFEDAAAISTRYESAAAAHFTDYQVALEAATSETGDEIFVDANKGLFDSLSSEFAAAIEGLSVLTPPTDAAAPHDAWMSAAQALNEVFQSADSRLATLTEAPAVNSVVSTLPLADLQAAYRAACETVAALAEGDPTPVIACDPVSSGA